MKKIVYIAHPISGDVEGNIQRVIQIVKQLNMEHRDICFIAPYVLDCLAFSQDILSERNRGVQNAIAMIKQKVMGEIWMYGNKISPGMHFEMLLAMDIGIPVVPKSPEIKALFVKMIKEAA